ncbi:hypothetical protein MKZ38_006755 [Zalerion maritima]|uniref:Uncharacterized protein n=1 Tax=Zalerion maritima TaxID=339359 RepID=A0AAD5WPL4_9PEZI|nr:hypothetical protein MKZ38_006755 [Zalerion maritima]
MADHTPTFFSPNLRTRAWAAMHAAAERDLRDHPPPPYTVYAKASGSYPHCHLDIHEHHDCHHQGHQGDGQKAGNPQTLSNYINDSFNREPRLRLSIYIHADNPGDGNHNPLQTSIHQHQAAPTQQPQPQPQQPQPQPQPQPQQPRPQDSQEFQSLQPCTSTRSQGSSVSPPPPQSQPVPVTIATSQSPAERAQQSHHIALDTLRIDYLKALLARHETHATEVSAWRRKRAMKRAGAQGAKVLLEERQEAQLQHEQRLQHSQGQQDHSVPLRTPNTPANENGASGLFSSSWVWQCRDFLAKIGHPATTSEMSKKERLAYLRQKRKIDERFGRETRGESGSWFAARWDEGDTVDQFPKSLEKALHHWTPWYPGQDCFQVEVEHQCGNVGDVRTANGVRYGGNTQTVVLKY